MRRSPTRNPALAVPETDGRPLHVLVVDDSPFTRRAIMRILASDPELKVIGQAGEGREALRLAEKLPIDVVTLDLAMPNQGGLETLRQLGAARRLPVVVLSALASENTALVAQALQMGAFEVLPKPAGGPLELHAAAKAILGAVRAAGGLSRPFETPKPLTTKSGLEVVLIGVSTGGPSALQQLIPALPANFPVPVVVLQHMPPGHTQRLAERLDRCASLRVKEACHGDRLQPGQVLVAPSGQQLALRRHGGRYVASVSEACSVNSHYRPCIDYTFQEAARVIGDGVLAMVLTGMGRDGAAGVQAVKAAGGRAWAQDEYSSTIYGMPRAARETGVIDEILGLDQIPRKLREAVGC